MATISKTGIADGLTSKAEHLTRIIDALDGTATTEVVATGSFTGSFIGDGSSLTGIATGDGFPFSGDALITGSLLVSKSFVDFTDVTDITVPSMTLGPAAETVNLTNIPAGSITRVSLANDNQKIAVNLPAASDNYIGTEWTFDIIGIGGSGDAKFQLTGSENKIYGIVAAVSSPAYIAKDQTDGVNLFQVSGSVTLADTFKLRSMGSVGWKVEAQVRIGGSVSGSFLPG